MKKFIFVCFLFAFATEIFAETKVFVAKGQAESPERKLAHIHYAKLDARQKILDQCHQVHSKSVCASMDIELNNISTNGSRITVEMWGILL